MTILRALLPCIVFLLIGAIASDVEAGFRHRRKNRRCPPCTTAKPLPQVDPDAVQLDLDPRILTEPTLEAAVAALLCAKRFPLGIIPSDTISDADAANPYRVAFHWSTVQEPLEQLFRDYLKLERKPKLPLVVKVVDDSATPVKFRYVIPAPDDTRISKALAAAVPLKESVFDSEIKLVGEFLPVSLEDFKAGMISDGKPNYIRIQKTILEMLQSKTELTTLAKKVGGEIKPIPKAGDVTKDRLRVLTQWQDLDREATVRTYWRVNVRLEKQAENNWVLETAIDFGERLRTQSPEQIYKITDSNQLGAFETDAGEGNLTRVKFKPVTTAGQRVLSKEYKEQFATMAPALWNQVKDSILNRKKAAE